MQACARRVQSWMPASSAAWVFAQQPRAIPVAWHGLRRWTRASVGCCVVALAVRGACAATVGGRIYVGRVSGRSACSSGRRASAHTRTSLPTCEGRAAVPSANYYKVLISSRREQVSVNAGSPLKPPPGDTTRPCWPVSAGLGRCHGPGLWPGSGLVSYRFGDRPRAACISGEAPVARSCTLTPPFSAAPALAP